MTKKELKLKIKEEQKVIAVRLHDLKASRKEGKRGGRSLYAIEDDIRVWKRTFRINHIAYCMFFNHKTIDEIECTTSPNYEPCWGNYESIMEKWQEEVQDEDVCDRAA